MALGTSTEFWDSLDRHNTVSVGTFSNKRQITNVAAGTAATDAINYGQLSATNDNITTLGNTLNDVKTDINHLTDDLAITQNNQLALSDSITDTNTLVGNMTSDLTAINAQITYLTDNLAGTNDEVTRLTNALATIDANIADITTQIAPITSATASGVGSVAYGRGANASATGSTALGVNASVTAVNSVALGAGSVADRANTISVGSAGNERQITHVAAGTAPTDAVNVQQLGEAVQSIGGDYSALNIRLGQLDTRLNQVGAMTSAINSLSPPPYDPQEPLQFLVGIGSYDGQTAEALGLSYYANGALAFNLGVATSGSEVMGSLGFACKISNGNRQTSKEDYSPEDPNGTGALQAKIRELQGEDQRLQAQIDELKQLITYLVNTDQ